MMISRGTLALAAAFLFAMLATIVVLLAVGNAQTAGPTPEQVRQSEHQKNVEYYTNQCVRGGAWVC